MSMSPMIPTEALQVLRNGQLIDAIKITRKQTGLGLKESKDLVEKYLKDHPHENVHIQQQLAQHRHSGIKFLVAVFLIIALLIWWMKA